MHGGLLGDDAALLLRALLLVPLDQIDAAHQSAALLGAHLDHFAAAALVAAREHDHLIALADFRRHHSTSGASEMIFMWFLARSSRGTGPKMRVPTGSICGFISTAALRSKRMIEPSGRLISFEIRTTTAFITSPFFTRPRGMASFTDTTITSPMVAYLRFDPPSTLMHMTRRAPELSATSRLVCIWIMTPPSSSQFPRAPRSHDLLLLAPNHFPALELGQRPALFDPDDVVHLVLVGLIVGVVFLRAPHRLLHDRVSEAALDAHHHGLVLLVAHHDALERALRHLWLLRLGFRARGAPRFGCWLLPRRGRCRRRWPTRTFLRGDRLDARDVTANLSDPRGVLELSRRPLEAQVEPLLLEFESLVVELVDGHRAKITRLHDDLLRDALDEARLDRQLGGGESKRLARHLLRHAINLEQDAPRFDAGDPKFRRPLARAHAHLERLLRHRHVRIDANPNPARALHVAGERAARGLDLARGDPLRLQRLEAELTERQVDARGRNPLDAAFVRLAELGAHRLQHGCSPLSVPCQERLRRVATRTPNLAFRHLLVLRHGIVFHDLSLEDPDLHAAGAVGGKSRGNAVVDIRAQRMQRHAALAIPFHARDLRAAEPARAIDADAAGAEPHRRLHGALHGAAEGHAALELLRDRFGDELGIELRLADLDDIDHDVGFRELGDLLAQLLDVGALLADDDARTRGLNSNAALLVRPFDHDFRYRRLLEILHQLLADLHVLVQQLAVLVLAGVPARIPGAVDAEPQADWIDLLTHWFPLTKPRPRPRARRWSGSRMA